MNFLTPNWPAPNTIKACTTFRTDGHSLTPYNSFNFSTMVGDNSANVHQNRQQLCHELNLLHEPVWLKQVHGTHAIHADDYLNANPNDMSEADASYTATPNVPCVVLTADCLPLLLAHRDGSQVAAIHAGWRGLAAGIIETTLDKLSANREDWLVWLGPAIGPTMFEVGDEVRDCFLQTNPQAHLAFKAEKEGKWIADIYLLARQRLLRYGIDQVYGGEYCTYSDPARFYSYRRDGGVTGRMASLICMIGENNET